MFEALAKALAAGLSLWEHREKNKYIDRLMALKRDYYEEYNQDPSIRSDSAIDHIQRELCILADAFSTSVGITNIKDKS